MLYEIDYSRFVYVSLGDRDELKERVAATLIDFGFQEKQVLFENGSKFAQEGDYIVQPIKVQEFMSLLVMVVTSVQTDMPLTSTFGHVIAKIKLK